MRVDSIRCYTRTSRSKYREQNHGSIHGMRSTFAVPATSLGPVKSLSLGPLSPILLEGRGNVRGQSHSQQSGTSPRMMINDQSTDWATEQASPVPRYRRDSILRGHRVERNCAESLKSERPCCENANNRRSRPCDVSAVPNHTDLA
jgi:hypothetical protein